MSMIGVHKIKKKTWATNISRHQMGDMKQVQYWEPTKVRRHRKKIKSPGQSDARYLPMAYAFQILLLFRC